MKDGYAPVGAVKMYYREAGSGQPVVFIHAGVADSRMWQPQLYAVPDGFRFLAIDQRGFGRTPLAKKVFAADQDVLAILDFFRFDRAVLVACSMGSGVALDVTQRAPDRVAGLVLVGGGSPGYEPECGHYEPPEWPEAVREYKAGDFEKVAQLDAGMWVVGYGRTADHVDPEVVELLIDMDMIALRNEDLREKLQEVDIAARADGMSAIDTPTLVVVGEHDLPDLRAAADDLARKLSDRPAAVIPGAAHLAGLEQPEEFNRVLFEFLASL